MQFELLPDEIKHVYAKIKNALSLRGILDGLSELLVELEWSPKTKVAFLRFTKRMLELKKTDLETTNQAILWVNQRFKDIQKGTWKNEALKDQILPRLKRQLEQISDGRQEAPTYFEALITLLDQVANTIAPYGECELLNALGSEVSLNVSIPQNADPLVPVNETREVLPFTPDGDRIAAALGKGFIKAKVCPPVGEYKKNRYFIDQSIIKLEWPDVVIKALVLTRADWRTMLDLSAPRCLTFLNYMASWQDFMLEEKQLHPSAHDKDRIAFYEHRTMKNRLSEILSNKDLGENREAIIKILNRFLSVFISDMKEPTNKKGQKARAQKYANRQVKAILLHLEPNERRDYTYTAVKELIVKKAKEADVPFHLSDSTLSEACKYFSTTYDWPKKRGKDKTGRGRTRKRVM